MTETKPLRRQIRRSESPRVVRHKVLVTEAEEARLAELAAVHGVTVARLLVESALRGGPPRAVDAVTMVAANRLDRVGQLLGKIGVNVNQMAKAANATQQVPANAQAVVDAVERTRRRIDAWIDETGVRL